MTRALLIGLLLSALGCAGGAESAASGANPTGTASTGAGNSSGPASGAAGSGTGAGGAGGSSLPPETEVESSYEVPVATGNYIWVANPLSGRVAYVGGAALDVHTVEAGNAPTYLAPIPSATDDAVIVLNVLSDD